MKVVVNRDNCIGCGACESIEPNVFQLDDEGISAVIEENVASSTPIIKPIAAAVKTIGIEMESITPKPSPKKFPSNSI